MKITRNMTEGNIYKAFLGFAFPLLLSYLLSQVYTTVDAVIAGKFINEYALGAISATSSYENLFHSLFNGFAAGFGIYIAQQFGKGDHNVVKRDIVTNGMFVAGLALVISIFSVLFRNPIMDYLKVDPVLRKDAEAYFVIYTMGYLLTYVNMLLVQALYALGCTSFSLYVSFIAAMFKIGGNLLSVLVLKSGVGGLAVFSVLSNAAATVCYLLLLRKVFKELGGEKFSFRFRLDGIQGTLRYALPAAVQQVAFHGVGLLIAPSVNALGADATTAFNIATRIYNIGTLSLWAVSNAFTCYTSQCVGKGDHTKIPRGLRTGFLLNCLMMIPFAFIPSVFARSIVTIFVPAGYTGAAYEYAVRYAAVYLPFIYVQLVGHILHSYMRSLGSVTTVLGITLVCSTIRVASTIWLVPMLHLEGAFWGQILSWAVDAVISIVIVCIFFRTPEQLKRITEKVRKK